jgi:hypothetical protein
MKSNKKLKLTTALVLTIFGVSHINAAGGMACCGEKEINTAIQFCCNGVAHDINKTTSNLSFDLSKYFELIKGLANAIPNGQVEYTPPGGSTIISASTEKHEECCADQVKTFYTSSKSITLGLGSVQASFPVAGVIPGIAEAGIRLRLGGSLSYSLDDSTDCDKTNMCGSSQISGEGSFCVYGRFLLGVIDIEGCGTGSPSTSAQVCYDSETGAYEMPSATLSMDVTLNYTVIAVTWSQSGSISAGTYSYTSG